MAPPRIQDSTSRNSRHRLEALHIHRIQAISFPALIRNPRFANQVFEVQSFTFHYAGFFGNNTATKSTPDGFIPHENQSIHPSRLGIHCLWPAAPVRSLGQEQGRKTFEDRASGSRPKELFKGRH
jgi:hypothetical protein